ncbi:MAG: hypothetical protein RLZZ200_1228 [Pseudomonadota bacterium]|jgi:sterol desaturase/sphingolipid hydroxylase (fatty acid hydroxylase superfamily)
MTVDASEALALARNAVQSAYSALALSIPLVALGIATTGSIYFLAAVRTKSGGGSWAAWLRYLFPREHYTSVSARVDILVWLVSGLVIIPVYEACVALSGLLLGGSVDALLTEAFGPAARTSWPVWCIVALQFLGFHFGFGAGQYGGHLAFHKVPALWALHRAHHSAESPNLFAFLRTHPLEIFLNGALRVLGGAIGVGLVGHITGTRLLPEASAAILAYNVFTVLTGFRSLDHSHIPVRYGKVLDVLIGSPIMHQVHHSAEPAHRDVNLAGAGYLYDWIFGTLYIPRRGEVWRWGLNEEERGDNNPHNSLAGFFIEPVRNMWRELGRPFNARR